MRANCTRRIPLPGVCWTGRGWSRACISGGVALDGRDRRRGKRKQPTVDVGSAAVRPVQGATRQNDAKSDYCWILAGKCPKYISGAPHARDGVLYCAT